MEQLTLMQQGVDLMLFGMGTVFVFLMVLIVTTLTMSAIVRVFEKRAPVTEPAIVPMGATAAPAQGELIAVISAAIKQHRNSKK